MKTPAPTPPSDEELFLRDMDRRRTTALGRMDRLRQEERDRLRELHWLRCPHCGLEMENVHFHGLQFERCFSCGGSYFDEDQLEQLTVLEPGVLPKIIDLVVGSRTRTADRAVSPPADPPELTGSRLGSRPLQLGLSASLDDSTMDLERLAGPPPGHALARLLLIVMLLLAVVLGYLYVFERFPFDRPSTTARWQKGGTTARRAAIVRPAPHQPPAPAPSPPTPVPPPATAAAGEPSPPAPAPPPVPERTPETATEPAAASGMPPPLPEAVPAAPEPVTPQHDPPAKTYEELVATARRSLLRGAAGKALEAYEKAAAKNPQSPEPLDGMGWAYVNLGKPELAILRFQAAVQHSPRYGDAYIGLGEAYRLLGRTDDAVAAYRRYLDLHPRGPSASIAQTALNNFQVRRP